MTGVQTTIYAGILNCELILPWMLLWFYCKRTFTHFSYCRPV